MKTIGSVLKRLLLALGGSASENYLNDITLVDRIAELAENGDIKASVIKGGGGENIVPISKGGTGANNAADARANLGAVSKTGDTISGVYSYTIKMRDTSHYTEPICFENETPSSYTHKPHIGFHNTGGNSSHPGVINIIPFGTNVSPWERADGLSISRDNVKFNGSDVRVGTVAVANGGTGATTAAAARTNLGVPTLLDVYPVGSIYMSVNSTSPATLFGGTWEQLEDTFLLAAGQTYTAGDTGGEAEHTLTVDEMPRHKHDRISYTGNRDWTLGDTSGLGGNTTDVYSSQVTTTQFEGKALSHWATSEEGGGQAHNNMPPYLAVYMWKRTA